MGSHRRPLQPLLAGLAFVLSIGFLMAVFSARGGVPAMSATVEGLESSVLQGRGRPIARHDMDLVYVSKRRVPNGADPIHNRRAGKSGRPPGKV